MITGTKIVLTTVVILTFLLTPIPASTSPGPPRRADRNYQWVIALIAIAGIGILSVIGIEIYIIWKLFTTPQLRQWNSLWLGHVLLFGILCSYILMFAFLPYPSSTTCGIIRFCVGVCYSMCFSVVLVKLVISLFGPLPVVVQVLLFGLVWCVQIVIDIQWLIKEGPTMKPLDNQDQNVCDPGYTAHVQSLVYVMFLIVVCAGLSMLTRYRGKDPVEGMLIGIACGFTIGVWIIWILLGFLNYNTDWYDPCMAFGLETTVTILLLFMVLPKIYQLYHFDRDASIGDSKSDLGSFVDPSSVKAADSISMVEYSSKRHENGYVNVIPNGSVRANGSAVGNGSAGHDFRLYQQKFVQPQFTQVDPIIEVDETFGQTEISFNPNSLYLQHPLSTRDSSKKASSIVSAPGGPNVMMTRRTNQNYSSQRAPKVSTSEFHNKNNNNKSSKIQIIKLTHDNSSRLTKPSSSSTDLGYGSVGPTMDTRTYSKYPLAGRY